MTHIYHKETRTNEQPETKKALVTGASSGIGRAFVQALARQGFCVTGVARRKGALDQVITALGSDHRYLTADLTDPGELAAVARDIEQTNYHLLVNNAGSAVYDRFENASMACHDTVVQLNVMALVRLSHAFLTRARSGDALINVSSALSRLAYPGGAVYCGTKGFVSSFTESLWYEYKEKNIYIMALLPGMTRTDFHGVALGQAVELPKGRADAPETIVADALTALKTRRVPSLVSGRRFRFLTGLAGLLLPRRKMITIMGKQSMGLRREPLEL